MFQYFSEHDVNMYKSPTEIVQSTTHDIYSTIRIPKNTSARHQASVDPLFQFTALLCVFSDGLSRSLAITNTEFCACNINYKFKTINIDTHKLISFNQIKYQYLDISCLDIIKPQSFGSCLNAL